MSSMMSIDSAHFLLNDIVDQLWKLNNVFALIGCYYSLKLVARLTKDLVYGFRVFVRNQLIESHCPRHFGKWAVVTGCTDGIGKQYAIELARRCVNLVLVSRNMNKLTALENEIKALHNVEVKLIKVDFTDGKAAIDALAKQLSTMEIGILVNNVGTMQQYPMYLTEIKEKEIWDMINVNVAAMSFLTRAVLPQMLTKKKGLIVNISSSSALGPIPLLTVYSATKSYVDYFSRALRDEVKSSGVMVQTVLPFYVVTNMVQFNENLTKPSLFAPSAETYARSLIKTIGATDRTTGYWSHGLQYYFSTMFPVSLYTYFGGVLQRQLRKSFLSKEQAKQE